MLLQGWSRLPLMMRTGTAVAVHALSAAAAASRSTSNTQPNRQQLALADIVAGGSTIAKSQCYTV
jgi:hypothetical protein